MSLFVYVLAGIASFLILSGKLDNVPTCIGYFLAGSSVMGIIIEILELMGVGL